jgi:nucleotide-binding universal stress UspA family protein
MYRTILIAYSGADADQEALCQGAELARAAAAEVVLLSVLAADLGLGYVLAEAAAPTDLPDLERAEIARVLEAGAARLREAGLSVQTRMGVGNPAEAIGRVAREIGAELIVVGHRAQSRLARWWSGSTGASLLNYAPCSVLVAMPPATKEK